MSSSQLNAASETSEIPSFLLDECKALALTIDRLRAMRDELKFFPQGGGLFNFLIRISTATGEFYFKKYRDDVKPTLFSPPNIPARERANLAYRVQAMARSRAGDLYNTVPEILAFNNDGTSFIMEGVPEPTLLIEALVEGRIPSQAVEILPKFLARLHRVASVEDHSDALLLNTEFRDFKLKLQYEDVGAHLGEPWADIIRRFSTNYKAQRKCIVHGDINSRNILLWDNGQPCLSVIDYEQSHLGEQTFDLGYILCEFLISTLYFGRNDERSCAMRSFLENYFSEYGQCDREVLERAITMHTGCQGIYRFIGPSRKHWTSYIPQEAQEDIVNQLRGMIEISPRRIGEFL